MSSSVDLYGRRYLFAFCVSSVMDLKSHMVSSGKETYRGNYNGSFLRRPVINKFKQNIIKGHAIPCIQTVKELVHQENKACCFLGVC